ncbi:hypothetical protein COCON_G00137320 [Conger conger]|uniref:Immunoglobulin V-set domain-containing protein n=1 Tax=Conger conger TaxID=82655 RepID=A0A9Q1DFU9_CONCO|nr:hypothetical protein COCON_G00137320 [Conger conger]
MLVLLVPTLLFAVCGDSLQLNGVVGKSILLPTEERLLKGIGDMNWKKKSDFIITLVRKSENSPFEIRHIDLNFKGRLIVNNDTGALNISNLREEDSGEYVFGGIISSRSLEPVTHKLQVYGMIVSVQVTTQLNISTDSCNVTLSCSVFGKPPGGTVLVHKWRQHSRNREQNYPDCVPHPGRRDLHLYSQEPRQLPKQQCDSQVLPTSRSVSNYSLISIVCD